MHIAKYEIVPAYVASFLFFMVRRGIQFILPTDFAAVDIVLNFRHQRLHERLVTANKSYGVPLFLPAWVTTHLDAVRVGPSG